MPSLAIRIYLVKTREEEVSALKPFFGRNLRRPSTSGARIFREGKNSSDLPFWALFVCPIVWAFTLALGVFF